MKNITAAVIILHGLIHFMGFVRGFNVSYLPAFNKPVTMAMGTWWFVAGLLFIITSIVFFFWKEYWWMIGFAAIIVSQILVIAYWRDAKAGTIFNLYILIAAVIAFGNWQATQQFKESTEKIISLSNTIQTKIITSKMIDSLPPAVARWLTHAGVEGKSLVKHSRIIQSGIMRTKPADKWMAFSAEQITGFISPSFVWKAEIHQSSWMRINAWDEYIGGKGTMTIAAFHVLPFSKLSGDKVNQGSLVRWLAEICWSPTYAFSEHIRWEAIDNLHAKATLTFQGITVRGFFTFDGEGNLRRFESERYKVDSQTDSLEKWIVEYDKSSNKIFEGITIPGRSAVSWYTKEGQFTWLQLSVKSVYYSGASDN